MPEFKDMGYDNVWRGQDYSMHQEVVKDEHDTMVVW